jgi:hypothetical protein
MILLSTLAPVTTKLVLGGQAQICSLPKRLVFDASFKAKKYLITELV